MEHEKAIIENTLKLATARIDRHVMLSNQGAQSFVIATILTSAFNRPNPLWQYAQIITVFEDDEFGFSASYAVFVCRTIAKAVQSIPIVENDDTVGNCLFKDLQFKSFDPLENSIYPVVFIANPKNTIPRAIGISIGRVNEQRSEPFFLEAEIEALKSIKQVVPILNSRREAIKKTVAKMPCPAEMNYDLFLRCRTILAVAQSLSDEFFNVCVMFLIGQNRIDELFYTRKHCEPVLTKFFNTPDLFAVNESSRLSGRIFRSDQLEELIPSHPAQHSSKILRKYGLINYTYRDRIPKNGKLEQVTIYELNEAGYEKLAAKYKNPEIKSARTEKGSDHA